MYFSAKLAIKLDQETILEAVKPTRMFGKLFHYLTVGRTSEKEEHQTFTALSILQQFNIVFRKNGINNIVRLAKDDFDFYFDENGVKDDLQEALDDFELRVDKIESDVFQTLYLVLEHEDQDLRYLLEIDIRRKHKVGESPILILINGVLTDFNAANKTPAVVKQKMTEVFEDQEKYDAYLREKKYAFELFISTLEQSIRTHIKLESLDRNIASKMIRPRYPIGSPPQMTQQHSSEPVYHGYYGYSNVFFYAWLWSAMCYDHNIYCHDFTLVDEAGNSMLTVGESGFEGGLLSTLNPEEPFTAPISGDIEYHEGHDYQEEFKSENLITDTSVGDTEQSGSWIDSWSGDSSDGGSSCSSCSSCGGI